MSGTVVPQDFSRYPLLWLAASFACGITIGHYLEVALAWALIPTLVLAISALSLRPRGAVFALLSFISLGAVFSILDRSSISENRVRRIYDDRRIRSGEPVEIEGVLIRFPESSSDGTFLLLRSEVLRHGTLTIETEGNVRLFIPAVRESGNEDTDLGSISYGSRVIANCSLEREERFQNPGVASRIALLDQQGIDATGSLKSSLLLDKVGDESVFLPMKWVYEQRQWLTDQFRRLFSPQTAGVMIASLLGNQNFLDRETSETFRDGGTFHVLVISGLHITFIGGLVLWVVSLVFTSRSLQSAVAAAFLWAYTLSVGAEVPVVRASLMFTALLVGRAIHRPGSQLNTLGLCILLLLVWRPADLFSASFQLTTVSVAAIVACSFPLIEKLRAIGRWMPTADEPLSPVVSGPVRTFCETLYWNDVEWQIQRRRQIWSANLFKSNLATRWTIPLIKSVFAYTFEGILVSIIVQIWMLPLLVVYFHRISPVSVVLNLWVGVLLTLESFSAVFAVLVSGVSDWLAAPLVAVTEIFNAMLMSVPTWFSDHGLAGFRLPVYPGAFKTVYFLFGMSVFVSAMLVFQWKPFSYAVPPRRSPRATIASLMTTFILGIVVVFHPFSAPAPNGRLQVDFLDVGQGDSALITFPDGETMLVDGGGEMDFRDSSENGFQPDRRRIGESVVSEFLWEKGYSRIDYLVSTHADADHIQGLIDVARNFNIGSVLLGTTATGDPDFDEFMRVIEAKQIEVDKVQQGDVLSYAGVTVEILNPSGGAIEGSSNDRSVVMKLLYGSRSILLTGDIERAAEAELVNDFSSALHADVVKIAHHGSRTSSTAEFMRRTGASVAVISVGIRSRFGHPHPEVVTRWLDSGAQVLKTGDRGTISITTDGQNMEFETFVP